MADTPFSLFGSQPEPEETPKAQPPSTLPMIAKQGIQEVALRREQAKQTRLSLDAIADPQTIPAAPAAAWSALDVTNFLFGDDMAAMGMKLTQEGLDFDLETMKHQWAEHPVWSSISLATNVASVTFPLLKSYRLGRIGQALDKGFELSAKTKLASKAAGTSALRSGGKDAVETALAMSPDPISRVLTQQGLGDSIRYFQLAKDPVSEGQLLKALGILDDTVDPLTLTASQLRDKRGLVYSIERQGRILEKKASVKVYDDLLTTEIPQIFAAADSPELKKAWQQMPDGENLINWTTKNYPELIQKAEASVLDKYGFSPVSLSKKDRFHIWFDDSFANAHFSLVNSATPTSPEWQQVKDNIHSHFDSSKVAKFREFQSILNGSDAATKRIWQLALSRISGTAENFGPKIQLSDEMETAVTGMVDLFMEHQRQAIDVGMFDEGQEWLAHIAALSKNAATQVGDVPSLFKGDMKKSLFHSTLIPKAERSTPEAVWSQFNAGELAVDSVPKFVQSFIGDRMLMSNYLVLRDLATHPQYAVKYADMMKVTKGKPISAGAGLINLEEIFSHPDVVGKYHRNADVLRRMVGKKDAGWLGPNGELPFINQRIYDEIVGEGGMFDNFDAAEATAYQMLSTHFKFMVTAANPATHMQNGISTAISTAQAGMNLYRPKNLSLLQNMKKSFNAIGDVHKTVARNFPDLTSEEYLMRVRQALQQLEPITYEGKTFSPVEFSVKHVADVVEESGFEKAEGLKVIPSMIAKAKRGKSVSARATGKFFDTAYSSKAMTAKVIRGKSVHDSLEWASDWYLAEDSVPKMALYIKKRADGMTPEAAAYFVARKMPMYSTTGSYIRSGRKTMFPWLSYPVEALRITKNNLLDNPFGTMPWFYASDLIQTMMGVTGFNTETPEGIGILKRGTPIYSQGPQTVAMDNPAAAGGMAGGVASAGMGLFGAMLGGKGGAAAGAALGALSGAGAYWALQNMENGDYLRTMLLNWIPQASFMPQVKSDDYVVNNVSSLGEYLPSEPFAIARPFISLITGEDAFGNPITSAGPVDKGVKFLTQALALMSPPWMAKYGFKVSTPDVALSELGVNLLKPPSEILGTVRALDPTNVSRLMVDAGLAKDSITGKPGNPYLDILLNTMLGTFKSSKYSGTQFLSNAAQANSNSLTEQRTHIARQLRYYIQNGDDGMAVNAMADVWKTFWAEHGGDPNKMNTKWEHWIKSQSSIWDTHPALNNLSKEARDSLMDQALLKHRTMTSKTLTDLYATLKTERQARVSQESYGKSASLVPNLTRRLTPKLF